LISEKRASERTWARQGRKMEWAVSSIAMFVLVFVFEGERVRFDVSCCGRGVSFVSLQSGCRGGGRKKERKEKGGKDNVHQQVNPTFLENQTRQ